MQTPPPQLPAKPAQEKQMQAAAILPAKHIPATAILVRLKGIIVPDQTVVVFAVGQEEQ